MPTQKFWFFWENSNNSRTEFKQRKVKGVGGTLGVKYLLEKMCTISGEQFVLDVIEKSCATNIIPILLCSKGMCKQTNKWIEDTYRGHTKIVGEVWTGEVCIVKDNSGGNEIFGVLFSGFHVDVGIPSSKLW